MRRAETWYTAQSPLLVLCVFHVRAIIPNLQMGGCISNARRTNSKLELDDINANAFQVVNIDDNGTALWSGQLNVTRSEIILYRRGCEPTRWPLKCLRRYGFDTDLFSFEVGRRCATGEGIYAFRCRRAETIFQTLQNYIQMSTLVHDGTGAHTANASSNASRHDASSPMSTLSGQPVSQTNSQMGTYVLPNTRASNANRASVASGDPRRSSDAPDSDYLEPIVSSTVIARGAFNVITHGCPSSASFEPISPNSLNSLNNVSEMTTSEQAPLWTSALPEADKQALGLGPQAKKLSLDIPPQEFAPSPNLLLSNYVNGNRVSCERLSYSPTKPLGDVDLDANQPTYVNVTPGEMPSSAASTPKAVSADFKPPQSARNPNNNNFSSTTTTTTTTSTTAASNTASSSSSNNNNYLIDYTPCYENLDLNSMRSFLRGGYPRPVSRSSITSPSLHMNDLFLESLSPQSIGKVNYIVLDLDQSQSLAAASSAAATPLKRDSIQSSASNGSPMKTPSVIGSFSRTISQSTTMHSMSSLLPPESPQRGDFDYVTIDFNKTVALSNSIATATENEGSRRTRHSSTILPNLTASTPHNSVSD